MLKFLTKNQNKSSDLKKKMFSHGKFSYEILSTSMTMEESFMLFSTWKRHLRQGIVQCVKYISRQNVTYKNI